jgi:hypothetical protein
MPITKKAGATGVKFFFTELCIFFAQIFVFFMVVVFTSDFLRSESRLAEFATAKINGNTMPELGLTLIALTLALGAITLLGTFAPSKFLEDLSMEVLQEMPRTIYFFGSSITAITIAIAVYTKFHPAGTVPAKGYAAMAVFFAVTFFVYGSVFKFGLLASAKRRAAKSIIASAAESTAP